ncbi:MAG: hypothetical protein ABSH22_15590 [Tepidisphaeraceae bacterium]
MPQPSNGLFTQNAVARELVRLALAMTTAAGTVYTSVRSALSDHEAPSRRSSAASIRISVRCGPNRPWPASRRCGTCRPRQGSREIFLQIPHPLTQST